MAQYPDVARAGSDPARHYADFGEAEGRDAGPTFSATVYAQRHPDAVGTGSLLFHAEQHGQAEDGRPPAPPSTAVPAPDIDALLAHRFLDARPLPVFAVPHDTLRLSVVTDGIGPVRLHRGAGIALILATLTAQRIEATLRIVTRTEPADPDNFAGLLDDQAIEWIGNMDFVHAPGVGTYPGLPAGSGDRFIVTSWAAAWATRQSVPQARIAYVVHEDERLLYPAGDDRLRCSEILRDPNLLYIATSGSLLQSLQADGSAPGGIALDPIPSSLLGPVAKADDARQRFLLDANPSVPGDFYWRGLEAVSAAIDTGVLDPAVWDIHLAGADVHDVTLPGGVRPILLDRLSWTDYAAALRTMDLSLCLLDSSQARPDLVAGSAVLVGSGSLDLAFLVTALRDGVRRATEVPCSERTASRHDWYRLAGPAMDRLACWAGR